MQKLLSHPAPSTEHNSHWFWRRGGGVTAKKHFVVINVSESVSKAFLKSSAASNGGLAHRECHRPSFICLANRRNRSTGVGLQASHTHRLTHTVLMWEVKSGSYVCVPARTQFSGAGSFVTFTHPELSRG